MTAHLHTFMTLKHFFCFMLPGNQAGHTSDWKWPKATRLLSVHYGECGTARSPWCRGRWVWPSRVPCSHGCSNPLTTPHFFQHSGQTIRSACCGQVLSWRDSRSSAQSHASRYQMPQPTHSPLYAFKMHSLTCPLKGIIYIYLLYELF